jgi:hypothetical protein
MVLRGAAYPRSKNEFYETPAETTMALLKKIKFNYKVCDPACGRGAIHKALVQEGYTIFGDDISRGYDFITKPFPQSWYGCDIVTNPPFGPGGRTAVQFIERALEVTALWNGKVAMLLQADFDSAKTRQHIFRNCTAFAVKVVLLNRIRWFDNTSGSVNHCWFVWDHKNIWSPHLQYVEQVYPEENTCLA